MTPGVTIYQLRMILPESNDFQGDFCDIVIHLRQQRYHSSSDGCEHLQLHRISEGHAGYAPLHYVLLFPYGEPGWYYEFRAPGNQR